MSNHDNRLRVHTGSSMTLKHRFNPTPSEQQSGIRDRVHAFTQWSLNNKLQRRRLSNCLFYTIFAIGVVSFFATEFFIRTGHSDLATLLGQRKNDFLKTTRDESGVTSKKDNDAYATKRSPDIDSGTRKKLRLSIKGETSRLRYFSPIYPQASSSTSTTIGTNQEVGYPDIHSQRGDSLPSARRFTQIAKQGRKKPWPLDSLLYSYEEGYAQRPTHPQLVFFDWNMKYNATISEKGKLYPAVTSDNAQLEPKSSYHKGDISDAEITRPAEDKECVLMNEWQTAFYPNCNKIHEIDLIQQSHSNWGGNMHLFGTNGYWRNAWKLGYSCTKGNTTHIGGCNDTVVLKTLKFQHSFVEANYEHARIDSMAMERLTSSAHVIDIFGVCANSVVTEFADGERVGTLADKKKKTPLARLKIARDIASGLADVHSIDGNANPTFVHFDVNLANVVSVGGRLKLNDFNVGVMLKRNVTSDKACGFSAQYPNPQWRSPEEANGSRHLTEKVDVFSLGHIFFRLICLHEPWHKLEPGYIKGEEIRKHYVNEQVKQGILPTIPKEVMKSKDAEVAVIREAMLACYAFDPNMRSSARSIANFLDKGIAELSKYTSLRRPGKDHWGSFRLGKK